MAEKMRISGGEYIKKKLFYTYIGKIVGKGAEYNEGVEWKFEVEVGKGKKRIDALLRIGGKVNMAVEMVDGNSEDKIKDVTAELLNKHLMGVSFVV